MASAAVATSGKAGSDDASLRICERCDESEKDREAKYYCEDCSENLCNTCADSHKKTKATRKHTLALVSFTLLQEGEEHKKTFTVICNCDLKREVQIYCEEHNEVICKTCQSVKHRHCKINLIQDKALKYRRNEFLETLETAESLKSKIQDCLQDREADRKKLESKKEECIEEIVTFRQEIRDFFDNMEKELLVDLNEKVNEQLQVINKHITALSTAQEALKTASDTLQNSKETDEEEIMFAADVKITKTLAKIEALIHDVNKDSQPMRLSFKKNRKITNLVDELECLGKIKVQKKRFNQHDKNVILDMEVKSVKKIDVRLSEDRSVPNISGCTFLSNDYILLCDQSNSKIKLLDSTLSVADSLTLKDNPSNIAAINEDEAIISYKNPSLKKIQFVQIFPDMKLGEEIELSDKCYGLSVVSGDIYTACHKSSGRDEIFKLEQSGKIKSKTRLVQDRSYWSNYLSVSRMDSIYYIYLSDWSYSKVTCLKTDGSIIFQFEDEDLKRPNGIYVDSEGNSLVCGTNSSNVIVVTADGAKHRELLTSKEITKPRSIAFRSEDDTLLIGCEENSNLFIFRLKQRY